LGAGRAADRRFLIGSVKANIGHLESAAGVAGLIKVMLALRHEQVPPQPLLHTANPHIPWAELPLRVPTSPTPWPRSGEPRLAGLSSFGLSGINAHAVIEEPPPIEAPVAQVER